MDLLVSFIAAVVCLLFYNNYYKRRHLPPGPPPLPLLGNVLTLTPKADWPAIFQKWREQYGDIYTIWLMETPMVLVNNYAKIIEMFHKDGDSYANRPTTSLDAFREFMRGGDLGVADTSGELWRTHRRFVLHAFRDFGLGKDVMQQRILDEIAALVDATKADALLQIEVDVVKHIDLAVGSVINQLLFGYRLSGEHRDEFTFLKSSIAEHMRAFGHPLAQIAFKNPKFFSKIPGFRDFVRRSKKTTDDLFAFFEQKIAETQRKLPLDGSAEPSDYVEAFLLEKTRRDSAGESHDFTIPQLKNVCLDLWIAGQETTSTTLAWGLAYLLTHPNVQDQLHKELEEVVGSERLITMADRPQLPITGAVVDEIQRLCNLLPINLTHETTRDVVVDGFHIPKGTIAVPQISSVLYDEKIFPDPRNFDPSRFIDSNGRLKKSDEFIPFSVGKRQCLGEGLARMELFLFTANLFNQFKFTIGKQPPSMQRVYGGTVQCPSFTCRVTLRHSFLE